MDSKKLSAVADNEFFEYLLVADTNDDVSHKVMAEKQLFSEEYKEKTDVTTKPQVVVACFLAKESMEDTIIRWMQRICSNRESFKVTLNNYSGIPPHTIYLRIQDDQPFRQLAKELKVVNSYVSSCSCPPMTIVSHPHVSIARLLPEEVYFKALTQYAHKSFHESFVVNELLLLRRKHQYEVCKPINVFGLQPCKELFN